MLRRDAVTCGLDEPIGSLRARVEASPYGFALVVSKAGVLLGRLGRSALEGDADARAEDAMEAGPSTVRPGEKLAPLVERLRKRDLRFAIATLPDGRLVGVVRRADAEALLRDRNLTEAATD